MIGGSAALGVLVLGVLVVTMWLWLKSNRKRDAVIGQDRPLPHVEMKRVISRYESPSEEVALDLVKRGLGIRKSADVAEYFHLGSASADEVSGFLSQMGDLDGPVEGMGWSGSMDRNGLLMDGVVVRTRMGSQLKTRLALLTPDENGRWKIDFDAYARKVEPSWDELLEKQAGEGLVRVIVKLDRYYNGPFHDDSKWVCYGMISPDTDVLMMGYCRVGSPQERAMARVLVGGDSPSAVGSVQRATLMIRRIEGSETRQFEISRVLAEDWVLSDKPLDAKYE